MAELKEEGREATLEVAEELLRRLEAQNYIPMAEKARREYLYVLLREYRGFLKSRQSS